MYIPRSKNVLGDSRPSSQNLPFQKEIIASLRGVQICERGSISASGFAKSASGYGPGGPNPRGVQIRGGSESTVTPDLIL